MKLKGINDLLRGFYIDRAVRTRRHVMSIPRVESAFRLLKWMSIVVKEFPKGATALTGPKNTKHSTPGKNIRSQPVKIDIGIDLHWLTRTANLIRTVLLVERNSYMVEGNFEESPIKRPTAERFVGPDFTSRISLHEILSVVGECATFKT